MSDRAFDTEWDRRGTASVKWDLLGRLFGRDDLLPLWVADSDFPAPEAVVRALRERVQHPFYGYTYVPDSWFEAIQGWLLRRHRWRVERDWIVFSPGIVPALHAAVQALAPAGSPVVLQPPVYGPFFNAIEVSGCEARRNPLRETSGVWTMDLDHLDRALTPLVRLLFLCSPHNPVSRVWSESELRALGQLCFERGVTIVSDEIHADLVLGNKPHRPLAALSPELGEITITCMSASKTFGLAGLVNAWLVIPNRKLRRQIIDAQNRTGSKMAGLFGLTGTEAALNHGEGWLETLLGHLLRNRDRLARFVHEHGAGMSCAAVEGTYLAWLDCRAWGLEPDELRRFFIEDAGLALEDGRNFGTEGTGHQRLNFACSAPLLERALGQLADAIGHGGF
ncbi:MAG TPA: PatB family C-S lyase [Gemmatales bacterium]|nr:PatB family C-S lyase [Gemmatales bacterium]